MVTQCFGHSTGTWAKRSDSQKIAADPSNVSHIYSICSLRQKLYHTYNVSLNPCVQEAKSAKGNNQGCALTRITALEPKASYSWNAGYTAITKLYAKKKFLVALKHSPDNAIAKHGDLTSSSQGLKGAQLSSLNVNPKDDINLFIFPFNLHQGL